MPDRVRAECHGRTWEQETGEGHQAFQDRIVADQRSRGNWGSLFIMEELNPPENLSARDEWLVANAQDASNIPGSEPDAS
jgi:hypothetical protein